MDIPTNMHLLIFLAACVLFTTTECATSFQDCPGGSVDVVQNTTAVLNCVGYSAPITWEYKFPQSSPLDVGECTSSSTCNLDPAYDSFFTLTATNGTSSELGLKSQFTKDPKTATFTCDEQDCIVNIVEPPTEPPTTLMTTTTTEKDRLSGGEKAGITIACIVFVAIIIVVIVCCCKKRKKCCFETNGDGTGSTAPSNGNAPGNPAKPNAPGNPAKPIATGPAVPADGRTRELPQPKRRQGATATPNETPGVVDNASSSPRTRQLPQPRITEHNMTTSVPPPSLPPLRTQATTSLTSVERNSFAETKKPLPSISPRETQ